MDSLSPYLFIVCFGLVLKLAFSYREILSPSSINPDVRPELLIFIGVFLGYSVVQILLFAPYDWAMAIGLPRIEVVRLYYFFDGVGLIIGGYLVLSILGASVHKKLPIKLLLIFYILIGSYFLFFTEAFISSVLPNEHRGPLGLGGGYGGTFINLHRAVVLTCLIALLIGIYQRYHSAKANEAQIKSLYALISCFIYYLTCFIGLFKVMLPIIALRGVILFVVVLTILRRETVYDIRVSTPITAENRAIREFRAVFRQYANEKIDHRDALKQVERLMVDYKINKVSGFKDDPGSALPQVANSMGISLSTMYDLLKRLDVDRPNKKQR